MRKDELIKFLITTEKSVRIIEAENKVIFIVSRKATKPQIKEAVEKMFNVHVVKIRVLNDRKGRKKAYVQLKETGAALDIATKFGIM